MQVSNNSAGKTIVEYVTPSVMQTPVQQQQLHSLEMSPSTNNSPPIGVGKDINEVALPAGTQQPQMLQPSNSMIHLQNLNAVRRETTNAGDTEAVDN